MNVFCMEEGQEFWQAMEGMLWMEYLCPPSSYVEALTPYVIVFGSGNFGR